MTTWFTSDWHLNHFNIIKYCGRPFIDLQEMNSTIIQRFNERVKEDDLVFYLGDFCFKSGSGRGEGEPAKADIFRNQLNCKNIIFIEGNHDKGGKNSLKTPIRKIIIHYGGKDICMTHNPEHADFRYDFNIVGHVHEKWMFKRFRSGQTFTDCCNVSVEMWNYRPIAWGEIISEYSKWYKKEFENEKSK